MNKRLSILSLGLAALTTACSGEGGKNALVAFEEEAAGSNCEAGGTRVNAGADENENGVLDADEVEATTYVCNGAGTGSPGQDGKEGKPGKDGKPGDDGRPGSSGQPGQNGAPGQNGTPGARGDDGISTLIRVTDEPAGARCEFGGKKIEVGLDADGDGSLSEAEVNAAQTSYLCDGAPGAAGVAGFRLVAKYVAPGGPIAEIVSPSPDGNTLVYTSSSTGTIGFVDITDASHPTLLGTTDLAGVTGGDGEPTSVAFAPDGAHVIAVVKDTDNPLAADPGALVVVNAATRAIVGQVAIGVGPDSVALTPDGTKAVVAIEDEEDEGGNNAPQSRPGSVQVVTIDYQNPASSTVVTIALTPPIGNMPSDPQPEYVDITKDGRTAVVSLQENNVFAVIDLETDEVTHYLEAGNSIHARSDKLNDQRWIFDQPFEGQLQPDGTCLLPDQKHFITANEGDTSNGAFGGVFAGGRGFSVFHLDEGRVADSGDALEWAAFRSGAYPDARSANRGVEPEGCGAGTFGGKPYAFVTGERNSTVFVVDVSQPRRPVIRQMLGAPNRPESVAVIESRGLFAVGGEGDGATKGGGIWLYEAVTDAVDVGHGAHVYDARSPGGSFGALSALAYQPSTGFLLGIPDNAYAEARIWSFAVNHAHRRVDLVDELLLRDAAGEVLVGIDPEGLVVNPEGGFVVATEGTAGNGGGGATCAGGVNSNRVLFFTELGQLDARYGDGGVIDLPCGSDPNAFAWSTMSGNGFEGVTVVDSQPNASGGLKVYVAFQRPLAGAELAARKTRIGEYDVDSGEWNFYFYELEPDVGGDSGNTFLSELVHIGGDRFAVIERDQGYSFGALNKTIRTFSLSSGTVNDPNDPVEKTTAIDLLADSFRFDQEKIEGVAVGGGSVFIVNDNDGGQAQNFFVRFSANRLGGSVEPAPEAPSVVINEVKSNPNPDFVELYNPGSSAADISGWKIFDNDPGRVPFVFSQGTTIAAGGYLVVEGEGVSAPYALGFGLGSGDSVLLYTADDELVDSVTWSGHATTASRCPNGSGAFTSPTTETKGATNSCP